jgi:4-amino-4-deoxy-L-arabinose transferase-like glycosyltransferase
MVAGHLREGLNQLSLVLLLTAFILPLFVGLGRVELENDEAIYSYAVASILDTGEWASPRSSPNPDVVFLEKPPLKFWVVAAPLRLGLLPPDEFGLRFWDAVFGGTAFVYVFLIGRRLSGAICGAVALLVLFAHEPLLFAHGLRSNNMEAALFLSYCGGIYHYLALMAAASTRRRTWHIAAISGWFFLGFMTKFVAALFLPVILVGAAVLLPAHRQRLFEDRGRWGAAVVITTAAILPWFAYQYAVHGTMLLQVMFGEHVYTRFTEYADPRHVQPWHFYLTEASRQLARSGSAVWVVFGLGILAAHTAVRRLPEGVVLGLWLLVPLIPLSMGTSKLYHYFYPYLPPLAVAAGYGVGWVAGAISRRTRGWISGVSPRAWGWRRGVFLPLAYLAAAIALATAIEPIRLELDGRTIFSNHSVVRPLLAALGFAWLAGHRRLTLGAGAVLLLNLMAPTPLDGYSANLRRLTERREPLKQLGECLREVDQLRRARGEEVFEPYTPLSSEAFLHTYSYYLRGSGWLASDVDDDLMHEALFLPGRQRPVVIDAARYHAFIERARPPGALPPGISRPDLVILLPADYNVCRFDRAIRPR